MRAALALAALLVAGCIAAPGSAPAPLACDPCATVIDASADRAWEPHVAVDPRDPSHVVALSGQFHTAATGDTEIWMMAHVSRDGGATWATTRVPGPERTNQHADPVALFLSDGALLVAGLAWTGTNPQTALPGGPATAISTFVVRSDDGGETFGAPVVVAEGRGASLLGAGFGVPNTDKPWMALAPDGTVLLTYLAYSNPHPEHPTVVFGVADIHLVTSKDGRAWSEPVALPRPERSPHFGVPAVTDDGAWHVAFADIDFSTDPFHQDFGLYVASSRDRGATWDLQKVGTTPWMPMLVARGGTLYLASAADAGEPDHQPPMLMISEDAGATWSAPRILDQAGKGRAMVTLAVDARGFAYVAYYRNAAEADGPAEFRVVRVGGDVADAPLVLEAGLKGPTRQRGHYVGLGAASEGAHAVWVSGAAYPAFDVAGARVR